MSAAGRLDGKTAIVTGAAGGIGRALVAGLVDAGARVAAVDLAEADYGAPEDAALALACDVSDDAACERAVAACAARFGRIDGLVNNAGIGMNRVRADYEHAPAAIEDIAPGFWREAFAVNAAGAFFMTRAAAPRMRAQGAGRVVSVTTSFFTMLRRGWGPYGASKAALEAASAGWAAEFAGTGVTVNVLVPGGPADTAMVPPASFADRAALIPPEAMAPPACWLMSDAAGGVTGRRFVAAKWDPALPPEAAAEAAGAPIGWPELAAATVVWPGGAP